MMPQMLAHLWGDYVLQSDWMANRKRLSTWACLCRAFLYTLCFIPLVWFRPLVEWNAVMGVIFWSHFWIDRFGWARYVVWLKNWIGPSKPWYREKSGVTDIDNGVVARFCTQPTPPFRDCAATGYPPSRPAWLAVWLLIIADNTLHLTSNYLALRWL